MLTPRRRCGSRPRIAVAKGLVELSKDGRRGSSKVLTVAEVQILWSRDLPERHLLRQMRKVPSLAKNTEKSASALFGLNPGSQIVREPTLLRYVELKSDRHVRRELDRHDL